MPRSESSESGSSKLSIAQLQRIEQICSQFEQDFNDGKTPAIDSLLVGTAGIFRRELLRELVLLDMELRREQGHTPDRSDYLHLATGPNDTAIEQIFQETMFITASSKSSPTDVTLSIGSQVGPYTLQACLGEGGMGKVFFAKQSHPIQRDVAIKLVRPELASEKLIQRFQHERQTLAIMNHPHIAKVLDAGSSESGAPYFVMELVSGEPITDYCQNRQLPLTARLQLFLQICHAVQHAHQKGIIHRDLKPSNILITECDDQPTPKIIDFGLATLVSDEMDRKISPSGNGNVMGTLSYMSPEQADGNQPDVDTRADVYALGVVLFEILTNRLPRSLSTTGLDLTDALQQVRTVPVQRVRDFVPNAAQDLDWIAYRALAANRLQRYESASALANDIQRFLDHQVVSAVPHSASYVARKFVFRNKILVSAAAVTTAALLLGLIVSTAGFLQASHDRDLANKATQQTKLANEKLAAQLSVTEAARAAEAAAKQIAKEEAETTDQVNRFMSQVLGAASPHRLGREATVRDAVDEVAKSIDQAFLDRPKVRSAVLSTLASTYSDLGEFVSAEQYAREALEIYRQHCGATHEATLSATDNLTRILYHQKKFAECETLMRQLVTDTEAAFGPDSKEALIAMNNLATQLFQRNQLDESGQLLERVLASKRRTLGDADESTLSTWGNYASLLLQQGQKQEALSSLQTIADLWIQHYGERNPGSLMALEHLAFAQSYVDVADAIPIYVRLVELRSDVLSKEHPHTMRTILNLGTAYLGTNQPNDAIPLFRQLKEWNESNASQAGVRYDAEPLLAIALASAGQADEAEELMRNRVTRLAETLPNTDSRLQVARVYWAYCLVQAEMISAANTELESLILHEDAPQLPPDVSGLRSVLIGRAELENGAFEQAEPKLLNGYATLKVTKGREFVLTRFAQNSIRLLYQDWERPERWEEWKNNQ